MSFPKHHHFVPEMILNGFTDDAGWLHWCRLNEHPIAIRPARASELFYKKHLYSTVSEAGIKDPAMERQLSGLESAAAEVVSEMIEEARAGRPATFSAAQKHVWYLFLLMQWRRTPETQRAVASDAEVMEMLDEALEELRTELPTRRDKIDALATPEAKARILRNVRVNALGQLSINVMQVLERRGITVLRIQNPKKKFVVGSRPVVKITPRGHTDLNDPIVEMWLPVASDIAAGVGNAEGGVNLLFLSDDAPIRQLNSAVAAQSSIIAAASPALVRSLANAR